MKHRCAVGYTAADAAEAALGDRAADPKDPFVAHTRECAACYAVLVAMVRAKGAWRGAMERDDAFARGSREERIASASRGKHARRRSVALAVVLAAISGVALAVALRDTRDASVVRASIPNAAVTAVAGPLAATSPVGLEGSDARARARAKGDDAHARWVVRACSRCEMTGFGPRVIHGDGMPDVVELPAGARLVLGWALEADAMEDGSAVEVDGPASVRTGEAGSASVTLDRGRARVDAIGVRELRTPRAVTRGAAAAWVVETSSERTRIDVIRGTIQLDVVPPSGTTTRLAAGDSVEVRADGMLRRHTAPRAPRPLPAVPREHAAIDARGSEASPLPLPPQSPAEVLHGAREAAPFVIATPRSDSADTAAAPVVSAPEARAPAIAAAAEAGPLSSASQAFDVDAEWRRARDRLARGDRGGAEPILGRLVREGRGPLIGRAQITLGELQLARGARADARKTMLPLVSAADAAIAYDAAYLLARAEPGATDRAHLWTSYLAVARPSPFRELAELEYAAAEVDAGRVEQARAIVAAVRSRGSVPGVARPRLERVEQRLRGAR